MLRRSLPLIGALAAMTAIFWFFESNFIYSFQTCIGQQASDNTAHHTQYYAGGIGAFLHAQSACTLRLVDRHNGFFAALGGLAVAAFTFTLWRSTEKLWLAGENARRDTRRAIAANIVAARAATRSARAAENALLAEIRPIIAIVDLSWNSPTDEVPFPHISFGIRNSGHKTAILGSISISTGTFVAGKTDPPSVNQAISGIYSAIEPQETLPGSILKFDTMSNTRYSEINTGLVKMMVAFDIASQDIIGNKYPLIYPFMYDSKTRRFERADMADKPQSETAK